MSHHTATLQSTSATAFDFACTVADRLYWLDDNYVQPFYSWAASRLCDVAISGLYWGLIALIDVALWLTDTIRQFMARDAHAIALIAFAQAHAPLTEFPALAPATVPLALPSALPLDSIQRWLTSALPLVPSLALVDAPVVAEVVSALPSVVEAAPVTITVSPVPKSRKAKNNTAGTTDTAKTPRKRSPKTQKTTTTR